MTEVTPDLKPRWLIDSQSHVVPVAWQPSFTHWQVVVLQSIVPQWQVVNDPGVHAAPAGHEHAPHAQPLEQVCVP